MMNSAALHTQNVAAYVDAHSRSVPQLLSQAGSNSATPRYSDRICSPSATLARVQRHLADLGISRIADQTGLDRIGIPTYAAFRPNSKSLAVNQGKGFDHPSAKASAAMEAIEFAIAEQRPQSTTTATIADLTADRLPFELPIQLMPMGYQAAPAQSLDWIRARHLWDGTSALVPFDVSLIDGTSLSALQITRTTNGLSSGNCREEAIFHGLCELIERDAATLFSLRRADQQDRACVSPCALRDPVVDELVERIRRAGLQLKLIDQTTDIGVPVFMAVISEPERTLMRHFDVSAGYGCHPVPARAAIRAITEAAQSRITNIAGSRDDFDPAEYRWALKPELKRFAYSDQTENARIPDGYTTARDLSDLTGFVKDRLTNRGVDHILAVDLGGEEYGVCVTKLVAHQLEDRPCNPNWRPGARAAMMLLEDAA